MKVLFCQLRTFGDVIRTFPVLKMIKKAYPDSYISYTCYPDMQAVCRLCEDIDEIIPQPCLIAEKKTEGGTRILDCRPLQGAVERIRSIGFDAYVDFHGVFQSALMGALSSIPLRVGRGESLTKDGAYLFYNRLQDDLPSNKMERHFELCRSLFPNVTPNATCDSSCKLKNLVSIFPGSSRIGILKRWSLENYLQLAKSIVPKYRVKFIFGPEEQDLLKDFPADSNCETAAISTWHEAKKIIEESRITIGNDSAYLHMAVWLKVPAVMITGATSYEINGVWRYGLGANVFPKNFCGVCNVWSAHCPQNHECMNSITPSEVYGKLQEYL